MKLGSGLRKSNKPPEKIRQGLSEKEHYKTKLLKNIIEIDF